MTNKYPIVEQRFVFGGAKQKARQSVGAQRTGWGGDDVSFTAALIRDFGLDKSKRINRGLPFLCSLPQPHQVDGITLLIEKCSTHSVHSLMSSLLFLEREKIIAPDLAYNYTIGCGRFGKANKHYSV